MEVINYYNKINDKCQNVFADTVKDRELLGIAHHTSACLCEFSANITDRFEASMLKNVSNQIETSSLIILYGLYRQALSTLRLSLELGLGQVYFSICKMEHFEWLSGNKDIMWTKIIDKENGVLSKRFSTAFFPELNDQIIIYNDKAIEVYRLLSEYVHGNYETWIQSEIVINKNVDLIELYKKCLCSVKEVIFFSLICRYLKSFTDEQIETIQFLLGDFGHIEPIRLKMGGPKEE